MLLHWGILCVCHYLCRDLNEKEEGRLQAYIRRMYQNGLLTTITVYGLKVTPFAITQENKKRERDQDSITVRVLEFGRAVPDALAGPLTISDLLTFYHIASPTEPISKNPNALGFNVLSDTAMKKAEFSDHLSSRPCPTTL